MITNEWNHHTHYYHFIQIWSRRKGSVYHTFPVMEERWRRPVIWICLRPVVASVIYTLYTETYVLNVPWHVRDCSMKFYLKQIINQCPQYRIHWGHWLRAMYSALRAMMNDYLCSYGKFKRYFKNRIFILGQQLI